MKKEEKPKNSRIDQLLVEKGLVESRQKAQALVMAGKVAVNGALVDKPGKLVKSDATLELKEEPRFVGRGGLKLEGLLDAIGLEVSGLVAMDVGSSTGGFTDCLLKRGALRVHAVDVGRGLIDQRLRVDPRVHLIEGKNIRHMPFEEVGEKVDLVVIDVSFISLELVLPRVVEFLKTGGAVLALIKPQFEVGKGEVGKGGIVRDEEKHSAVTKKLSLFAIDAGFSVLDLRESVITGAKGNREFWIFLRLA